MTPDEIITRLAAMNPNDSGTVYDPGVVWCFFCDAPEVDVGKQVVHTDDCIWVAANRAMKP